jgi:ComEC/Rec2-related protein
MRDELEKRPIWVVGLALAVGIAAFHLPLVFLLAPVFLFFLKQRLHWAIFLVCTVAGWAISPQPAVRPITEQTPYTGEALVVAVADIYRDRFTTDVRTEYGLFRMSWQGKEFVVGARLQVTGTLLPVADSWRGRMDTMEFAGRLRAEEIVKISDGNFLFQLGAQWRQRFKSITERSMDPASAAIIQALSFNLTSELPDEFKSDMERTGTIHLISASGFHVLLYAAGLYLIFSQLPIPRSLQIACVVMLLLIYAAGAGFRPPIVRSVLMATIGLSAYLFNREADHLNSLGWALAIYLAFQPISLFQLGFQLSFVTVAGLALWARWESGGSPTLVGKLAATCRSSMQSSFIALMASGPLVAFAFGRISLISIVANVYAALSVLVILPLALGASVLAFFAEPLAAGILHYLVQPAIVALLFGLQTFAQVPFAELQIGAFPAWLVMPYYLAWLSIWRPRARPA